MPLLSALIVAAGVGVGQGAPSDLAASAVAPLADHVIAVPAVPQVTFEIRELSMGSPDWRGALQADLKPVAREEAVAAWAVDPEGMRKLFETCQADKSSSLLLAPRMTARLGEPVRMTNEETVHFVAHLKRISDAPPNEGTSVAFQPETAEVHDGVRVVLTETRMKGPLLYAHVVVQSSTVLNMLTAPYEESIGPAEDQDPGVVRTSLLARLKPDGPQRATIRGVIQIPDVDTRRIEGEWLIPSEGAIVVSLGPHSHARVDRKSAGSKLGPLGGKAGKTQYAERLIVLSAAVLDAPPQAVPSASPAQP